METMRSAEHCLTLAPDEGCTVARCSCGHWRRAADLQTVTLTGRSREDALRSAHELHARGLDGGASA